MRIFVGLLIAGIVAALIWLIPYSIKQHQAWEDGCTGQGGHVDTDTKMVTTYDAKGKPTFGSTTTYYCLSEDGRILDIN